MVYDHMVFWSSQPPGPHWQSRRRPLSSLFPEPVERRSASCMDGPNGWPFSRRELARCGMMVSFVFGYQAFHVSVKGFERPKFIYTAGVLVTRYCSWTGHTCIATERPAEQAVSDVWRSNIYLCLAIAPSQYGHVTDQSCAFSSLYHTSPAPTLRYTTTGTYSNGRCTAQLPSYMHIP